MEHVSTIIPKNYFLDIKVYNKQKSLIIEGLPKKNEHYIDASIAY